MLEYSFDTKIYNPVVPAGTWVYMESRFKVNYAPCPTCEVWMKVDDRWTKATLTYDTGLFWFWFRARAGIYRIRFVGYKIRYGDEEYILEGPEYRIVVRPRPLNLAPLDYEVKVFKKITFREAYNKLKYLVPWLKAHGYREIYLCGGLVSRGYSFHDVDVYLCPMPEGDERIEIQDTLRRITMLPIEVRNLNKGEKAIRVG